MEPSVALLIHNMTNYLPRRRAGRLVLGQAAVSFWICGPMSMSVCKGERGSRASSAWIHILSKVGRNDLLDRAAQQRIIARLVRERALTATGGRPPRPAVGVCLARPHAPPRTTTTHTHTHPEVMSTSKRSEPCLLFAFCPQKALPHRRVHTRATRHARRPAHTHTHPLAPPARSTPARARQKAPRRARSQGRVHQHFVLLRRQGRAAWGGTRFSVWLPRLFGRAAAARETPRRGPFGDGALSKKNAVGVGGQEAALRCRFCVVYCAEAAAAFFCGAEAREPGT